MQPKLQTDLSRKIQAARQAGYSDAEIQGYLAQTGMLAQPQQPATPQPTAPARRGAGGVGGLALDILPFGRVAEKALTGRGNEIGTGELLFEALTAIPIGRLAKAGKLGTTAAKTAAKAGKVANVIGDTKKAGSAATRLGRQRIASTGLEEAVTGTEAGRTLFTQDRINQAAQTVFKRFRAKSPTGIKRELPKVRDAIFSEREALLKDTTGSIANSTVKGNISNALSKFGLSPTDIRKADEILARNLPELANKKTFSALDLSKMQKKLNASVRPSVFEGVAPNRADDITLAIKEAIDEGMAKVVPKERLQNLQNINKEISDLFLVNKAGTTAGRGGTAFAPFGIAAPKNVLRGVQRRAADQGERLLGRQVTLPSALAQFGLAEAGSSIASSMAQPQDVAQLQQTQPTIAGDLTQQDMFSQLTSALEPQMPTQPTQTGMLTQEDINQAILMDLAETGGKNVEQIQMIAQMYGPQATAGADLTAAQKQQYASVDVANSIVNELETLFNNAGGARNRIPGLIERGKGALGLSSETQAFRNARAGYLARIAKAMGETGVLTDQDIQRTMNLIPDVTATPEEAQIAFESIRQILEDSRQSILNSREVQ